MQYFTYLYYNIDKKKRAKNKLTSGNPTLDKNLECIGRYNPQLKEKLSSLPYLTSKIELIETELREPNLSFNDSPLHSQSGAESEAKEIFNNVFDSKLSMHIVFGIGLGHLFKEFCDNSLGVIILYEPNIEILRVALELVDFSNELSRKNIKVASDYQELKDVFEATYKYKAPVDMTFLNSYNEFYKDEISQTFKNLEMFKTIFAQEFNVRRNRGMEFVVSVLTNFNNSLDTLPLGEFKDIYKGKTALIISAGPSLDANIEIIKKNRDKFIIFCVGTAFKALAKEGIAPDFLNILEVSNCSGQVRGYDLSAINLIVEPFTNEAFQTLKVKQKFLYPAVTTQGAQYWSHLTGIDISEYSSGGTVSYEAMECAKMLGFSKIILVGQDLAYVNNRCYSMNSNSSDVIMEINPQTNVPEFKVDNEEKLIDDCTPIGNTITREYAELYAKGKVNATLDGLAYVKGITGEMLPTHKGYASFVEQFREFAHFNTNLDLINTSLIGAQIDGFKNLSLNQALENSFPFEKKELTSSFKYDKNLILDNLKKENDLLKQILKDFGAAQDVIFKLERELKRNNEITKDVLKYYKILLEIYDKITVEYFEKHQMFNLITMTESLDLKYYADSTEDVGEIRIRNIFALLKTYFLSNQGKLLILTNKIEQQITILSGNSN